MKPVPLVVCQGVLAFLFFKVAVSRIFGFLLAMPQKELLITPRLWESSNAHRGGNTSPVAWNITTGSANVIIAVIDSGFDTTHPDLTGNLWINGGEIAGNNNDDDNNGFVDDING